MEQKWIRKPTPVTTRIITAESGSSSSPHSATKLTSLPELVCVRPAGTHSNRIFCATRSAAGRWSNCQTAPRENTKETKPLPTHTALTAEFCSRFPTSSIRAAPARGKSGMSQTLSRKNSVGISVLHALAALFVRSAIPSFAAPRIRLPLQDVHFVGQHGRTVPEKRDDDAQPHGRFRRRIGDHEDGEDLAVHVAEHARQRDQRDVHRVQDQLDGHQDDDNVAAREHANHADGEERQAQEQVMAGRNHRCSCALTPFAWPSPLLRSSPPATGSMRFQRAAYNS